MTGKGYKKTTIKNNSTLQIGIVVAEWNHQITSLLLKSCLKSLKESGIQTSDDKVIHVPGSFELPMGARLLMQNLKLDAVICLGCLIKGETMHDEYIAQSVATTLNMISIQSGIPVIFGVLTTLSEDQALARSTGDHGDKGKESAESAIKMALLKKRLSKSNSSIGFNS